MNPIDIPTTTTRLVHAAIGERLGGPLGLSTKDAADLLAHFWPAIAEHFAQLILDHNPDRDADFSAGVDWAADTIRNES